MNFTVQQPASLTTTNCIDHFGGYNYWPLTNPSYNSTEKAFAAAKHLEQSGRVKSSSVGDFVALVEELKGVL